MANPEEPAPPRRRPALDWATDTGHVSALLDELATRVRRRQRRRTRLIAAGCAVILLGTAIWLPFSGRQATTVPSRIVISEPSRQTLPDGSLIELRDNATITVDFSGPLRRVTLNRGEAHFQVAKDPSRPFVVAAAGVDVRAVGTAFSVQLKSAAVEVLVTEGSVAVARPVAEPAATLVVAGQLAVVANRGPEVTALPAAETAARLTWRVALIEFSSTPLAEAIALLNRQSAAQLRLGDDSLAALRISGIVRADNSEALSRLLVANYEVTAARESDHLLILRRR